MTDATQDPIAQPSMSLLLDAQDALYTARDLGNLIGMAFRYSNDNEDGNSVSAGIAEMLGYLDAGIAGIKGFKAALIGAESGLS